MAFLSPDRTYEINGIEVCEKLIPDGSALKPNRPLRRGAPEWITIHNTPDVREAAGTNDAEQYARATHNGNMNGVSVHFYIDETACWQLLRENEMGWHAADGATGPGNAASIAIEIVMDGSGDASDVGAEDRGARLAAGLLHRYGLGPDRLKTHRDWYPAKYCPAYILPHRAAFESKVRAYLDRLEAEETAQKKDARIWRVQIGAFRNRDNAEALARRAREKGFEAVVN